MTSTAIAADPTTGMMTAGAITPASAIGAVTGTSIGPSTVPLVGTWTAVKRLVTVKHGPP